MEETNKKPKSCPECPAYNPKNKKCKVAKNNKNIDISLEKQYKECPLSWE